MVKIFKTKLKKRSAMTLLELIIYLSITMIVLVIIIDLVAQVGQNKKRTMGESAITYNSIFLLNKFQYLISNATAINGTYPANTLLLAKGDTEISTFVSDGTIFYQEGAGEALALTPGMLEISPEDNGNYIFSKLTNGQAESVKINFKVKNKNSGLTENFDLVVTAKGIQ